MVSSKLKLKGKEVTEPVASEGRDGGMDAALWGDLQNHIDLEMVYEKLPLQQFFLLRVVCKRWNRVACERRGFKDPVPKPYFVSMPYSWSRPNILAFNISDGKWVWKRLGQRHAPLKPPVPAFALHGLLYSSDSNRTFRELQLYVFDVHTSKEHLLPPLPRLEQEFSWDGMVVDSTVTPHSFKVIRGDTDIGTQIYDSVTGKWTTDPARPCRRKPPHLTTCASVNGKLYIRSVAPDIIMVYDLQKSVWSQLNPPEELPVCRAYGGSLGTWQGRLFTVTEHHNGDGRGSVSVCELEASSEEWREYIRMPSAFYNRWFTRADHVIWSSFCGEYVLVVAWHYEHCEYDQPQVMCLCNLAMKTWEIFKAPHDMLGIRRAESELSDDGEDMGDDVLDIVDI